MSLPMFRLAPGALDEVVPGGCLDLDGGEGRHAATVRRIAPGESVLVADGRGRSARAEVVGAAPGVLHLRVQECRVADVPSPRLVLVQALAKGGRDEAAIEAATELGVDEVVPWEADRSIVRWRGPKREKSLDKWRHVTTAAAKQSRRTHDPVISAAVTTAGLVERVGAAETTTLVLHEGATTALATTPLPDAGEILLVVGPEGGISPVELDRLEAAGAVTVRLGPTVLRSSSAGPAAIASLSTRSRWV